MNGKACDYLNLIHYVMESYSFQSFEKANKILASDTFKQQVSFISLCHHLHKIVKLSWDKWLITIKPVRLLHSPSCVKTPRAQNRSEDWQLPLPEDTSLLLVLICANASACGGVSILHRRGLGTLVRISQSALIDCKEQVSGAAAVHSMLHVYCAVCVCVCVHLCTDITFDTANSIGAFVLMLSFEYRSSV